MIILAGQIAGQYNRDRTSGIFLWNPAVCLILMLTVVIPMVHGQSPGATVCISCDANTGMRVYNIQSVRSQVHFSLTSLSAFSLSGVARHASGQIVYSAVTPEASEVTVELRTADIEMDNPVYNRLIKSKPFLHISRYPGISFISREIGINDNGELLIRGILMLRGVSQEETLVATLQRIDGNNNLIEFLATTSISRADYGMRSLRFLLSDRIEFSIEVTAVAAETDP